MDTPISSKMVAIHGSPSAAEDADVVRLFQKLLEDEEAEEVFREFVIPAHRRQTRFPWFLPSRLTLHYPRLLLRNAHWLRRPLWPSGKGSQPGHR
jgi:hypothetical protein